MRAYPRTPRFRTRELVLIALLAAMLVTAKFAVRIPIHVPGHSGALWIAMLVVGRGWIRKPGTATLVGLIAGVLATLLVPGGQGLLVWVKYAAAGVGTDVAVCLMGEARVRTPLGGAVAGAFANIAKLTAQTLVTIALGMPLGFAAVGLAVTAASHVLFGVIGGLLGSFVLTRLDASGFAAQWASNRR